MSSDIDHYNDTYTYNADQQAWVNSSGDYIYWGGTEWILINGANGASTSLGGTADDIASIAGLRPLNFHGASGYLEATVYFTVK